MTEPEREGVIREFYNFIGADTFPCVAAKGAMSRNHIACIVVERFDCAEEDKRILSFLYDFIRSFREATESLYSAAVLFADPQVLTEDLFEQLLWARLQHLSNLDAEYFSYDKRVSSDPSSPHFSFSLGEEAFFIIGLHPGSSRPSRKFKYPAIVFNPHVQFEELRRTNRYEKMKNIVRKRDLFYSGSVNPMLSDFGEQSEVYQYSGRQYDGTWRCPFKAFHSPDKDSSHG